MDVLRVNFENDLKLCVGQSQFRTWLFSSFLIEHFSNRFRAQHILINNISGILSVSYKSVFVLTIPVVRERIVYYVLPFPLRLIPYSDVVNRIIVEFSAIPSSNFLKMFVLMLGCLTTVVFYPSTRYMTYDKESSSWKMHHLISKGVSGLKQKCKQYRTTFSGSAFHVFSLGVIRFIQIP